MAREPKTTQDDPTEPRAVDADGRILDTDGLPVNGPARARALAERGATPPAPRPDDSQD